jgi:hypothetical protein
MQAMGLHLQSWQEAYLDHLLLDHHLEGAQAIGNVRALGGLPQ